MTDNRPARRSARSTASRLWRRGLTLSLALVMALTPLLQAVPAAAQSLPLIRDTEIELLLSEYSRPLFRAAGLEAQGIQMRIVRHDAFNAFVIDANNVFVNTGMIMQSETPNQVIGVIAHETGHIRARHLPELRDNLQRNLTASLIFKILAIGLIVAGGTSGSGQAKEGLGGAGQGILLGGDELIMRSLLADRRKQELEADQIGLRLLTATSQSGKGMLETFERFAQQEFLSDSYKDPFVRSHPIATDRLNQLRERAKASPHYAAKDPPALQLRHDMMRAKLSGYIENPALVMRRYPQSDQSLPARYARAIALNATGQFQQADPAMDALIREKPDNPYFWELKGQWLFRRGKPREAIEPLRRALKLAGGEAPLMRMSLAQTLLSIDDPALVDESIDLLRKALVREKNAFGFRQLALAYHKKGRIPEAEAAQAQAAFLEGNLKQAQIFAKRAQTKLRPGSTEWTLADDILKIPPPKE